MFPLGRVVMTQGISMRMQDEQGYEAWVRNCFDRYVRKDWGDLCKEDKQMNEDALAQGMRILGAYNYPKNKSLSIYIITEWDRSYTTILLKSEY